MRKASNRTFIYKKYIAIVGYWYDILFQIIGRFYTMKKEFGDCTRRLSLCFLFSNSAGGFSKSISFCRTYSPKKKTFFIQKILIQINDITLFHLLNYNNRGRSSKKLKLIIKKIRSFPLSFVFFFFLPFQDGKLHTWLEEWKIGETIADLMRELRESERERKREMRVTIVRKKRWKPEQKAQP